MGKIRYDAGSLLDAAVAYLQALRLADSETVSEDEADELRQLYEPIIDSQSRPTDPQILQGTVREHSQPGGAQRLAAVFAHGPPAAAGSTRGSPPCRWPR